MFWQKEEAIPLNDSVLEMGVYVWIDRSWKDHPFLSNRFLINSDEDLQALRSLGSENIYWIPSKSKTQPSKSKHANADSSFIPKNISSLNSQIDEKKKKASEQRRALQRAEREWEKSCEQIREAIISIRNNPKQNGKMIKSLAEKVSLDISKNEVFLLLLSDKKAFGLQHHALNVMSLSALLANSLGLPDEIVSEITLAAVAHDIGEVLLPKHIINSVKRSRAEENQYKQHPILGTELAAESGVFSKLALDSIREHHELYDGSGFPDGKREKEINLAARVLGVVSAYDRLSSPSAENEKGLLPKSALKKMWSEDKDKFDPIILSSFIKLLGVYPPGTIVELSNDELGLVISPGASSLHPKILIYDPNVPREEAEILSLNEHPHLEIVNAVDPSVLPDQIYDWLNPGARLSFYYAKST